jgi:integrase
MPEHRGFHTLRRTLGRDMTIAEIPTTMTAQVLGHRALNSTTPYISLDHVHLKECALGFSGIALCSEVLK